MPLAGFCCLLAAAAIAAVTLPLLLLPVFKEVSDWLVEVDANANAKHQLILKYLSHLYLLTC